MSITGIPRMHGLPDSIVIRSFRFMLIRSPNLERNLLALRLSVRPDYLGCIDEHLAVIVHSQPFGNRDFMALMKVMRLDYTGFLFRAGERETTVFNLTSGTNRIATPSTASTNCAGSH